MKSDENSEPRNEVSTLSSRKHANIAEWRRPEDMPVVLAQHQMVVHDRCISGIRSGARASLLIGIDGVGKTSCLAHVSSSLRAEGTPVCTVDSSIRTLKEIVSACADELGVTLLGGAHLLAPVPVGTLFAGAAHKSLVLIIDDAHEFTPDVLRELLRATRNAKSMGASLQLLVSGIPSLESNLAERKLLAEFDSLMPLRTLDPMESSHFVEQCVGKLSGGRHSIAPAARDRVAEYCDGNIGRILRVCKDALGHVEQEGLSELGLASVDFVADRHSLGSAGAQEKVSFIEAHDQRLTELLLEDDGGVDPGIGNAHVFADRNTIGVLSTNDGPPADVRPRAPRAERPTKEHVNEHDLAPEPIVDPGTVTAPAAGGVDPSPNVERSAVALTHELNRLLRKQARERATPSGNGASPVSHARPSIASTVPSNDDSARLPATEIAKTRNDAGQPQPAAASQFEARARARAEAARRRANAHGGRRKGISRDVLLAGGLVAICLAVLAVLGARSLWQSEEQVLPAGASGELEVAPMQIPADTAVETTDVATISPVTTGDADDTAVNVHVFSSTGESRIIEDAANADVVTPVHKAGWNMQSVGTKDSLQQLAADVEVLDARVTGGRVSSQLCRWAGDKRVVEVHYPSGASAPLPCAVWVRDGSAAAELLWTSHSSAGYCEAKSEELLRDMRDKAWVCEALR